MLLNPQIFRLKPHQCCLPCVSGGETPTFARCFVSMAVICTEPTPALPITALLSKPRRFIGRERWRLRWNQWT